MTTIEPSVFPRVEFEPTLSGLTVVQKPIVMHAKVIRGPNWQWGNQDFSGIGEIVGPGYGDLEDWCQVEWPNGTRYFYRVGAENAFDLYYLIVNRELKIKH